MGTSRQISSHRAHSLGERSIHGIEDMKQSTEKSYPAEDQTEADLLCRERRVSFGTPGFNRSLFEALYLLFYL